jgi:rhodanese-related sulfurtransferase
VKENSREPRFFSRENGRKIVREAICVAVVGVAIGFAANYFSPKGLGLKRDYFPSRAASSTAATTTNYSGGQAPRPNAGANTNTPPESPAALRLRQNGLQMVDVAQTWQLFHDPRYKQHLIIFVDARDDKHYSGGHIPGAYQFDHYHPEKYLGTIFPVCQAADQIVVYCTGGDCEDSEDAAVMLRDAGIANQKLFVFSGGITEWTARQYPLETGLQPDGEPQPGTGK